MVKGRGLNEDQTGSSTIPSSVMGSVILEASVNVRLLCAKPEIDMKNPKAKINKYLNIDSETYF